MTHKDKIYKHVFTLIPFPVFLILLPVAYFAGAMIGYLCSSASIPFVSFWLPSGIYLSALILTPPKRWPFVIIAAVTGNICFDLFNGKPVTLSLGFSLGNTFEAVLGALLLRLLVKGLPDPSRMHDLTRLVAIALFTPLTSAATGVAILKLNGIYTSPATGLAWWSGDFIGITLITPFVLSLLPASRGYRSAINNRHQITDIAIPFVFLSIMLYIMVFSDLMKNTELMFKFLFFLPLLWGVFRFRITGMTAINLVTTLIAAYIFNNTILKNQRLMEQSMPLFIISSQMFICVLIIVILFIGAVISEWRRTSSEMREKLDYEMNSAQIASLMSSCTPENVDESIREALGMIRTFLNADNSSILKIGNDGEFVFVARNSVSHEIPMGSSIILPHLHPLVISGNIFAFDSIDEIPSSADNEYAYARQKDIESGIIVPVRMEGMICRIFTVSSARPGHFSEMMIRHTAAIGEMLANTSIRIEAEKNLQDREEKFRQLADNVSEVFWLRDCATRTVVYANPAFEKIWRSSIQSLYGDPSSFTRPVHPDDIGRVLDAQKRMFDNGISFNETFRLVMADESVKYIWAREEPIRDHTGGVIRFAGIAEDVTEKALHEADLQSALREKASLLKEIHHRVKNNMQVISSLFTLSEHYISDKTCFDLAEAMKGRIHSMAMIHEQLYQADNLSKIDFRIYINSLAAKIKQTYERRDRKIDIQLDVAPVMFTIETAIPCALIVNELVSNSFKHAFGDRDRGTIRVSLLTADGTHTLAVSDDGKGFPEDISAETSSSLGLKLVQVLSKQIRGEIMTESGTGSRFTVRFPE